MKIVVIGGTGRIGSKTVALLRAAGHEALAAAPSTGVNTITGEGLDTAFASADVVVDLANSPSFEDNAAMEFFQTAGRNIFAAERKAGVKHHVALSVVGTEKMQNSGYFRAKLAQEELIRTSGMPYTLVHATQFFDFIGAIADVGTKDGVVYMSNALMQPMQADDVARAMAEFALGAPQNKTVDIAGPERAPISDFVARLLKATGDKRTVVSGADQLYFGFAVEETTLVPQGDAWLGKARFDDFLNSI